MNFSGFINCEVISETQESNLELFGPQVMRNRAQGSLIIEWNINEETSSPLVKNVSLQAASDTQIVF